jgi:DHA1 family bicyclomycin/chloramphenicol resistance-like MFS transporter
VGQLIYGPISDRYGRRPLFYAGLAVYASGAIAAALAPSFNLIILCRFVWGLGVAAPRSLAVAMVRDTSEGERMARVMSLAMAVFMVVPIMAPSVGALLMTFAPWRICFWVPSVGAVLLGVWAMRLPETLAPQRRRALSGADLKAALRAVVTTRETIAFGFGVTFVYGVMTSYLAGSEIIISDVFHHKREFPMIFGAFAVLLAGGALLNARIVGKLGVHRMVRTFSVTLLCVAAIGALIATATSGTPPFSLFCVVIALMLPCITLLQPNANTAAMAPLPHVAGMAAALLGFVGTAGGALLGRLIDSQFDGTVRPFFYGAVCYASIASAFVLIVGRRTHGLA